MEFPPFPGFTPKALAFLRDLKRNNEREWFKARKSTYTDEVQWPMRCLVGDVSARMQAAGIELRGDPKKSVFRIYRDVRFSKNKNPYKTNVSGYISPSGNRKESGGIYMHVEPGNVFVAGGWWNPETATLRKWRARIGDDPAGFLAMKEQVETAGLSFHNRDSALKRTPKGYEHLADHEAGEYLKWKAFVITKPFEEEAVLSPAFAEAVFQTGLAAMPLLRYGREIDLAD
ncbi:MAG: DUF2461 domain-containing protein [Bacteroidota bacterium]